ncbi:hypothetical protein MANAM107_06650 [Actinomyces capricornis]|uniref:Uncharacterized protein n=1 Tax=Actinomyces capricornis TaxID=2755559 RepID=A0ABN6K4C1_9ACTO|nr:hypothetical protein MANAM107_06650 [Actinomyces capricornis]
MNLSGCYQPILPARGCQRIGLRIWTDSSGGEPSSTAAPAPKLRGGQSGPGRTGQDGGRLPGQPDSRQGLEPMLQGLGAHLGAAQAVKVLGMESACLQEIRVEIPCC